MNAILLEPRDIYTTPFQDPKCRGKWFTFNPKHITYHGVVGNRVRDVVNNMPNCVLSHTATLVKIVEKGIEDHVESCQVPRPSGPP